MCSACMASARYRHCTAWHSHAAPTPRRSVDAVRRNCTRRSHAAVTSSARSDLPLTWCTWQGMCALSISCDKRNAHMVSGLLAARAPPRRLRHTRTPMEAIAPSLFSSQRERDHAHTAVARERDRPCGLGRARGAVVGGRCRSEHGQWRGTPGCRTSRLSSAGRPADCTRAPPTASPSRTASPYGSDPLWPW